MLFFEYFQTLLFGAVAAFAAPETPADEAVSAAPAAEDEVEADELDPRAGPWYPCSAGGGQYKAYLRESDLGPDVCDRKVTGDPGGGYVSCYKLRKSLGCTQIVNI